MRPRSLSPVRARSNAASVLALLAAAVAGCGDDHAPVSGERIGEAAAESFWLGEEFAGLELAEVLVPPEGAGTSTSFIYGTCEPVGDGGCAPPLEIQTWGACSRLPPPNRVDGLERIRGVLASFDRRSPRIELYTASGTVVVFADTYEQARAAAERLRQRDEPSAGGDLASLSRKALRKPGRCASKH